MNGRPRDEYLEFLLDPYISDRIVEEDSEGRFFSHVTVILNGMVVCGVPISMQRYLTLKRNILIEGIKDALPQDEVRDAAIEMHNDAYKRLGQQISMRSEKLERLWKEFEEEVAEGETFTKDQLQALEEYRREFLNLEDTIMFSGEMQINVGLLRVRLKDINGWALGKPSSSS